VNIENSVQNFISFVQFTLCFSCTILRPYSYPIDPEITMIFSRKHIILYTNRRRILSQIIWTADANQLTVRSITTCGRRSRGSCDFEKKEEQTKNIWNHSHFGHSPMLCAERKWVRTSHITLPDEKSRALSRKVVSIFLFNIWRWKIFKAWIIL
jgi:hypothetical protein